MNTPVEPIENPERRDHCVIYGGNGFVGVAICQALLKLSLKVTVVSRTGARPKHLEQLYKTWADEVDWRKGDALDPDIDLLASADCVICLIGSPPLPTFSEGAWRLKVFSNSEPNRRVIEQAQKAGVKQLVLMAAHVPKILSSRKFAYWEGKRRSIAAAEAFVEASADHKATIFYPSGIYGTRYLANGSAIPLHYVMAPIAWLQTKLPAFLQSKLPERLVSDTQVANAVASACLEPYSGCRHVTNAEIAAQPKT